MTALHYVVEASGKRKAPDDGGKPKLAVKGGTKGASKCKNKRHEADPNNSFCTKSHAHFPGWRAPAPAQAAPREAKARPGRSHLSDACVLRFYPCLAAPRRIRPTRASG